MKSIVFSSLLIMGFSNTVCSQGLTQNAQAGYSSAAMCGAFMAGMGAVTGLAIGLAIMEQDGSGITALEEGEYWDKFAVCSFYATFVTMFGLGYGFSTYAMVRSVQALNNLDNYLIV